MEDLGDSFWDIGHVFGFDGEFGEGFDGFDLIELLEVAASGVVLVAGAGNEDHGPGIDHSVG